MREDGVLADVKTQRRVSSSTSSSSSLPHLYAGQILSKDIVPRSSIFFYILSYRASMSSLRRMRLTFKLSVQYKVRQVYTRVVHRVETSQKSSARQNASATNRVAARKLYSTTVLGQRTLRGRTDSRMNAGEKHTDSKLAMTDRQPDRGGTRESGHDGKKENVGPPDVWLHTYPTIRRALLEFTVVGTAEHVLSIDLPCLPACQYMPLWSQRLLEDAVLFKQLEVTSEQRSL